MWRKWQWCLSSPGSRVRGASMCLLRDRTGGLRQFGPSQGFSSITFYHLLPAFYTHMTTLSFLVCLGCLPWPCSLAHPPRACSLPVLPMTLYSVHLLCFSTTQLPASTCYIPPVCPSFSLLLLPQMPALPPCPLPHKPSVLPLQTLLPPSSYV